VPTLIIPQGRDCAFYSRGDEDAFFGWLQGIPGVVKVKGVGVELFVTLRSKVLSDRALRELIGLHRRYGIPMRALAQFETKRNGLWFRSKEMFWYEQVFGHSP
jgi:hypothetical protein